MPARWLVGLALGLRQGEALGLWWSDVELKGGVLRVRRALQRQRGGGLVFTDPKTMRSKRTIPLPPPLVEALRQHRERQESERLAAGSLWHGSGCVFTTPLGTPVDPRNDYREFKKLLTKASLPSVRLHDLRHTAASPLLAQNVPARVVMEILGHSQIALTMNTYSHAAPDVSREAAERMAGMLWPTLPWTTAIVSEMSSRCGCCSSSLPPGGNYVGASRWPAGLRVGRQGLEP
jgi:integrase